MSSKLVYAVEVIRRGLRNVKATISTGRRRELGGMRDTCEAAVDIAMGLWRCNFGYGSGEAMDASLVHASMV